MSTPKLEPGPKSHLNEMIDFWRTSWTDVFTNKSFFQDVLAGFTVAAVAVPLNIALAVACGLPPIAGLMAGIAGGLVAAIFGGAPLQVTGPAAALNVMVLALNTQYGISGVVAACFVIGMIQILLMAGAAGRFIRFVPEFLLAGFTTGVGLKILDSQIPEFLGLDYKTSEIALMLHNPEWLHQVSWNAVLCGLFVAFCVISFKDMKRFPAALLGVIVVTAVSAQLGWTLERVGAVPSALPEFHVPDLDLSKWISLSLSTIPIALLAAIESLLSAQAIDRMTKTKRPHESNLELFGQGLANIASGFVGGMPVSGVVVRSSVNVQSGSKTRVSAMIHALIMLLSVVYLSHLMAVIPLSALAGLLCVVGWRLIELKTLFHLARDHRLEALGFACAMFGTVFGHLMMGLILGGIFGYLAHLSSKKLEKRAVGGSGNARLRPTNKNIRAEIDRPTKLSIQNRPVHYSQDPSGPNWLSQIKDRATVAASSFVHKRASVIGRVVLGNHVHIAAESSVRADEGSPFFIGSNSNIQDGVVIHALKEKWVNVAGEDWAVYIAESVSVAHQALIHGPCYIGDHSFVGFKAVVHDSVVGSHCYIGIGAVVVGVEIPSHRYVPHGMIVDNQDKVDALPRVSDHHLHFNEDVVDVNKGLAAAYNEHAGLQPNKFKSLRSRSLERQELDRF